MKKVQVTVFGQNDTQTIEAADSATVRCILETAGQSSEGKTIRLNGATVKDNAVPKDLDVIQLIPNVKGGI